MDSSRGWAWTWACSSQARFLRWPSPTPPGLAFQLLSLLYASPGELFQTRWPSSPLALPLIWLILERTFGTWMIPWSHLRGPVRLGLGDLTLLLPLLLLHLLQLHQHNQLPHQHPPAPPLRAQTFLCWSCRAFTMAYAWWCRVFMTWLNIGPSSAWRISWPKWPGQESSLLLWGEVRLLQPKNRSQSWRRHSRPHQRRHRRILQLPHPPRT